MLENDAYIPQDIEGKWYQFWEDNNLFATTTDDNKPYYSIFLPPPNVTGTLHMGHGFQYTLQDALVRYYRMRGFNTLWQAGTDHAGIATQMVVERNLEAKGLKRLDLRREEFIEQVWQWKHTSGTTIIQQMRKLGASCDWSRQRFTLDEGLSLAVTKVFIDLYNEGYIYRGKRLVNWDVRRQTAVSDLEVTSREEMGSMWYIKYPIMNGAQQTSQYITIATTRPETMLGDVAVAVNPQDERYLHLIGKYVLLPLVNRQIPIIADSYVEADFGTGAVKITPAHDFNDYAIGKRHNLPAINILTSDGKINNQSAIAKYHGIDRLVVRKLIVADLQEAGFLVEVRAHKLMVPRGERDDVIIEPFLTSQWFMRMDDLARDGLQLVADGQIEFVPDNWRNLYNQWLTHIEDWCISRQLWWGHRIPAYYDDNNNVYVASSLKEAQALSGVNELRQDEDVLDTWFSAALWCFSTLGWPLKKDCLEQNDLQRFLPSNVLVTGFDIIFFWVARMIMLTKHFIHKVPFKQVYVTGLIQDAHGNKMSKSKGNIIDPIDLIEGVTLEDLVSKRTANLLNPQQAQLIAKNTRADYPSGFMAFGADALRFSFMLSATFTREIKFDIKRLESARHFCNKLWNASRFVLLQHKQQQEPSLNLNLANSSYSLPMQAILLRLKQTIKEVNFAYTTYRFDIMAQRLYEFVWNDYCDWHLELTKVDLELVRIEMSPTATTATNTNNKTNHRAFIKANAAAIMQNNEAMRLLIVQTLLQVLECTLRLLHPLTPFISEELWQTIMPLCNKYLYTTSDMQDMSQNSFTMPLSIMLAPYPYWQNLTTPTTTEKQLDKNADQASYDSHTNSEPNHELNHKLNQVSISESELLMRFTWLKEIIVALRNLKATFGIKQKAPLLIAIDESTAAANVTDACMNMDVTDNNQTNILNSQKNTGLSYDNVVQFVPYIDRLAKVETVEVFTVNQAQSIQKEAQQQSNSQKVAVAYVANLSLRLIFTVDNAVYLQKLAKDIEKLSSELNKINEKLANANFIAKAPPALVATEKERCLALSDTLSKLQADYNQAAKTST